MTDENPELEAGPAGALFTDLGETGAAELYGETAAKMLKRSQTLVAETVANGHSVDAYTAGLVVRAAAVVEAVAIAEGRPPDPDKIAPKRERQFTLRADREPIRTVSQLKEHLKSNPEPPFTLSCGQLEGKYSFDLWRAAHQDKLDEFGRHRAFRQGAQLLDTLVQRGTLTTPPEEYEGAWELLMDDDTSAVKGLSVCKPLLFLKYLTSKEWHRPHYDVGCGAYQAIAIILMGRLQAEQAAGTF